MDEVSVRIDAPAERIYDLITDVTQMGRWSPECTGASWRRGANAAIIGAKFRGSNRHGIVRWWTHCTVTKAQRPFSFEFVVAENGMRWGYRLTRHGDGTLVTEYREHVKDLNPVIGLIVRSGVIGRGREHLMVEGMRVTLHRLKEAVEP